MMRLYLTLFAAAIAWVFVLYKSRLVRVAEQHFIQRTQAVKMWSATFGTSIALTLLVDKIFVAFDTFFAANNLAWLVAYLFGSIAFYQAGTIRLSLRPHVMERIHVVLWHLLLLLIPIYSILYGGWIMHSPEWPERIPRTIVELIFSTLFFGYGAMVGVLTFPEALTIFKQATVMPVKLRTGAGLLLIIFANGCFWFKLVFLFAVFFTPQRPSVYLFDKLALLSMGLAAMVFALSFIPQRAYLAIADSIQLPTKLTLLKDLEYLRERLSQLYPKLQPPPAPWWDKLRKTDFHIYQTVIAILDIRQILFAMSTVRDDDDNAHPAEAVAEQSVLGEEPASGSSGEGKPEMKLLYEWLKIPETADYQAILDTLQQASRALRNA